MTSVLVIGDDLRSFLAIVRSLGRRGFAVHAAPFDFSSPALRSRYLHSINRLPPYALSADDWLVALQALIAERAIDLIIPCDDRSLLPLHHHRAALAAQIALPNDEAMAVFFDKVKTRELAAICGVPIADGGPVTADVAARLGVPLALKPRSSMDLAAIGKRGAVRIIRDAAALNAVMADAGTHSGAFLEAYFAGDGVGVSVLAELGSVRCAFQHRRLQEASETGGSSSRISEPLNPDMLAAARAMCTATQLHGVAMFEFRHNPVSNAFILLEVNARFWGSLPLAIASGVDFPALLTDMLAGRALVPQMPYPAGVRRADLSGEYYRILVQSERSPSMPARALNLVQRLPVLLARMLLTPHRFDSFAQDDRTPWTTERQRVFAALANAFTSRLPVRSNAVKTRSKAQLRKLLSSVDMTPSIVFICHGNICRSPFAASVLVQRAAKANHISQIGSAGTLLQQDRSAPDDACRAAQFLGVNLRAHRSRYADAALLERADVIFLFDDRNALELAQCGADAHKIIRLGHLIGQRNIDDPFGRGGEAFAQCYEQIAAAISVIATDWNGQ